MNSIKKYDADVATESDINSEMNTSVMDTSKDPMAELFQAVCPKLSPLSQHQRDKK